MTPTPPTEPKADPFAGLDHPCRETCSGWRQGFEKAAANAQATIDALKARAEAAEREAALQKRSRDNWEDVTKFCDAERNSARAWARRWKAAARSWKALLVDKQITNADTAMQVMAERDAAIKQAEEWKAKALELQRSDLALRQRVIRREEERDALAARVEVLEGAMERQTGTYSDPMVDRERAMAARAALSQPTPSAEAARARWIAEGMREAAGIADQMTQDQLWAWKGQEEDAPPAEEFLSAKVAKAIRAAAAKLENGGE